MISLGSLEVITYQGLHICTGIDLKLPLGARIRKEPISKVSKTDRRQAGASVNKTPLEQINYKATPTLAVKASPIAFAPAPDL